MINNIFMKRKAKQSKSDIDKNSNSRILLYYIRFSSKSEPIGMIDNFY